MRKLLFLSAVLIFGLASCSKDEEISIPATRVNAPDGVVIDGTRWATRNVGTPGTFVENPENAGMFFQWNRQQGWAATGNLFDCDCDRSADCHRCDWNRTPEPGTEWEKVNDPCPDGWRVPTRAELESLKNTVSRWVTVNQVGGLLFGTAPNEIFLPAAGMRDVISNFWNEGNRSANYWSSSQIEIINCDYTIDTEFAWALAFWKTPAGTPMTGSSGPLKRDRISYHVGSAYRAIGLNVRCVAID